MKLNCKLAELTPDPEPTQRLTTRLRSTQFPLPKESSIPLLKNSTNTKIMSLGQATNLGSITVWISYLPTAAATTNRLPNTLLNTPNKMTVRLSSHLSTMLNHR